DLGLFVTRRLKKETQMEWREVVEHPSLKNLPFKIETNEWGKIMMAPPHTRMACIKALLIELSPA
ncbi:MAG: hypothetical protein M0Z81_06720, partial [Deltaproteobacteria bacterium]|nr:hypothetical protein [Deltaproteobacteria bacterium]